MFRQIAFTLLLGLITAVITPAQASSTEKVQTIILEVENMTCSICPITVRKTLERVPGVTMAEAGYDGNSDSAGWAKVTFDSTQITVDKITAATFEAGYPSDIKPGKTE
ncbi:hypothetical protein QQ73_06910 [Candidatus Endoriftia persephone str. Guaymas]|nr:hypothetical protein [Candidatus Endoriftia persephone str. Guaymas]